MKMILCLFLLMPITSFAQSEPSEDDLMTQVEDGPEELSPEEQINGFVEKASFEKSEYTKYCNKTRKLDSDKKSCIQTVSLEIKDFYRPKGMPSSFTWARKLNGEESILWEYINYTQKIN